MESIKSLHGVGEKRAKLFEKKGINTISDLLYYFPRDYEDRTHSKDIVNCLPGENVLVKAIVINPVKETRIRKNMTIYTLVVGDETGIMNVVWYNNRFIKGTFKTGDEYFFFGRINPNSRKKEMVTPVYERVSKQQFTGKIVPVYPLWDTMTQKLIYETMEQALVKKGRIKEYIPQKILLKNKLCDINFAIKNIHFPESYEAFFSSRTRLVFEELFFLQLALLHKKELMEEVVRKPFSDILCVNDFIKFLPFEMTKAQKRTIKEICDDLKKDVPMNRLIQGDVGSGKTAVAAAVMYVTVKNGYQAAIMAPTEILAFQHFETFTEFFKYTDIKICLLTSSTKNKKEIYEKIKNNEYDIIIGTHALIQDSVLYNNLGLVIADEQHRFGVMQRAKLKDKGEGVHTLIMTATPIPRTLAFILYGDLDISIIDELPPGRKQVLTYAVGEDMRKRIYAFIDKHLKQGLQCYVVCPLIEATQNDDLKNAVDLQNKMQKIFSSYNVGLIHGKMKPSEKDEVMSEFSKGNINILVSTTVIEVGVNVPNACVMVIENAERFGLSQLHQLRGRVGRGNEQAYCILFAHGSNEVTKKRMEIMCKSNDGFYISEEDLKLRGPGDFFGTKQHGLPELKIANLFSDMKILKQAQKEAKEIISEDRHLNSTENMGLSSKVKELYKDTIMMIKNQ